MRRRRHASSAAASVARLLRLASHVQHNAIRRTGVAGPRPRQLAYVIRVRTCKRRLARVAPCVASRSYRHHVRAAVPRHAPHAQNSVFLNGAAGAGAGAAGLGADAAAPGGGRFLPAYAASSSALRLAVSARDASSSACSAACSACGVAARQRRNVAAQRRGCVCGRAAVAACTRLVLPLVAQQAQRKGEDHQAAAKQRPLV